MYSYGVIQGEVIFTSSSKENVIKKIGKKMLSYRMNKYYFLDYIIILLTIQVLNSD